MVFKDSDVQNIVTVQNYVILFWKLTYCGVDNIVYWQYWHITICWQYWYIVL